MNRSTSEMLFSRAQHSIPGGVNSPVRAFKSVGGKPIFFKKAQGAWLYDEDNNRYLDCINSWGPMVLGHAHPAIEEAVKKALSDSFSFGAPTRKEVEMAELICQMVPSVEKVRLVNSGTEATMAAIRVARGFTGRDKIIKFEGCYHGHGDSFLIAAGSGVATLGIPGTPGVTQGTANDTLTAPFNDLEKVEALLSANKGKVASIIVEPVAGNMGLVLPKPNFLPGLRKLCDAHGVVLIFDEVMTGFRLAKGGVQELYQVLPDMTTLGKIIGGGLPVGAYGGKKEIMDFVAPQGPVYQAGTLSGNPIAMTAGLAMLNILNQEPKIFQELNQIGKALADGQKAIDRKLGLKNTILQIGSMFTYFFTDQEIWNFEDAKKSDTQLFAAYFQAMLEHEVYLAPSQFESLFVSTAIGTNEIQHFLDAHEKSLERVLN
jgi:glutamate-1-semialdehyde 2,1-aminomutase